MNNVLPPSSSGFDRPITYRIRVLGRIPIRWRDRLEGMVLSETTDESKLTETTLEGELADQSALAGLLNTIVELHLIVQSVEHLPRRDSMTLGPVDFIALEFPGNRFKGEILPDLFELVDKEIIRIIDLVIIRKDEGEVTVRELHEFEPGNIELFNPLNVETNQMITDLDIELIAGQLADNSTAGLLLIENLWAKKTQQAMMDADGRLVMFERIPGAVVEEALSDMAALTPSEA
ncbi:MAG: DUF6325 family protein [Chloroflexota bacterium]